MKMKYEIETSNDIRNAMHKNKHVKQVEESQTSRIKIISYKIIIKHDRFKQSSIYITRFYVMILWHVCEHYL